MPGSGSGSKGHDFLRAITAFGEANATPSSANRPVKLGRVDYDYFPTDFLGGINPRILFDGENTVSQKRYQVMPPYYPLPGQRVALIPVGTTYLIIGSVDPVPQDPIVQQFTATDTWEKPPGARVIKAVAQGGGGAGGGAATTAGGEGSMGGGGGGGAAGEAWIPANSVGASEAITVGVGGAGASGANGGSGGASSFGAHLSVGAGAGGLFRSASAVAFGDEGGAGSMTISGTSDFILFGGSGGQSCFGSGQLGISGTGGSSFLGGGGTGRATTSGSQTFSGNPGRSYGGGGGGAINSANASAIAGADGAPGIIIVTTYF